MSRFLRNAQPLAAYGWAVLPLHVPVLGGGGCSCGFRDCDSPGKHPRTQHGLTDASCDRGTLERWGAQWPEANIGIATGAASGFFVLDLDSEDALGAVVDAVGPLPPTLVSLTGRGLHLFFKDAEGVKNRAKLWPRVDVRGSGGYIVAPPSLHSSGKLYRWQTPICREIAEAPEKLLLAIRGEKKAAPVVAIHRNGAPTSYGLTPYQQAALESAYAAVRSAGEGQRNDTLNREAYGLAGLDIPLSQIKSELGFAAVQAGLPQREIDRTIQGALARGAASPRLVEPLAPSSATRKKKAPKEATPADPDVSFHKLTDTGNAERLILRHGENLKHLTESDLWYLWTGSHWTQDRTDEVARLAKETIREALPAEAKQCDDEKIAGKILGWAQKSESRAARSAMVKLAASDGLGVQCVPEQLDADPWLLNCKNGTIDLKTGQLRPHQRADHITKLVEVDYDPKASCPLWLAFLSRAMGGSADLVGFLKRSLGYTLTGDTREHCLWFLYGLGNNGKSTFLETLRFLFFNYGAKASFDTFLAKQSEGPRNDIARLRGSRLVAASEAEGGKRFAESLLKEITGGDTISARFLHQEFFEFKPQFKIWLAANDKPTIKGTDHGIWRRIRLVPFLVKIPDEEIDKSLPEKLKKELPGILAWIVEGCLEWQAVGLGEAEAVKKATQEYRDEMDLLGDFIAQCCRLGPSESATSALLYKEYKGWATENSAEPVSQQAFGRNLSGRGLTPKAMRTGKAWYGIGLLTHPQQTSLSVTDVTDVTDIGPKTDTQK